VERATADPRLDGLRDALTGTRGTDREVAARFDAIESRLAALESSS